VPGHYIVKHHDGLLDCNLKGEKTYKPECSDICSMLEMYIMCPCEELKFILMSSQKSNHLKPITPNYLKGAEAWDRPNGAPVCYEASN